MDILYRRLTPGPRRFFDVLIHLASISLFAVMIIYGYQFADFVHLQTTPALQLPKWIVLSIIPFSGAVLLIHGITFLVASLKRGR